MPGGGTAVMAAMELETAKGRARAALALTDRDHRLLDAARAATRAPRTKAAYRSAWQRYARWCQERGVDALPSEPELVAAYLAERADAGRSVATLSLELAAISQAHLVAGLESPRRAPRLAEAWKGIKRLVGQRRGRRPAQKAPLVAADIVAMLEATPADSVKGARDRAVLALGFAGAFRRSELAALNVRDLELVPARGMRVTVRVSKADQEGEGAVKRIPFGRPGSCPVRAVEAWREVGGIDAGPLFRRVRRGGHPGEGALSGHAIACIIKDAAGRVALDPARYSGHSLRAGHVTSQLEAGVDSLTIRRATGHRSDRILAEYDRRRDVWVPSGL